LALPLDRAWECPAGSRDTTGEGLLTNAVAPVHLNPARVEFIIMFVERRRSTKLRCYLLSLLQLYGCMTCVLQACYIYVMARPTFAKYS